MLTVRAPPQIFFGYDSGYINGVTGSPIFIEVSPADTARPQSASSRADHCPQLIEGAGATSLTTANNSLIVSILSAGTFFGALIAGEWRASPVSSTADSDNLAQVTLPT